MSTEVNYECKVTARIDSDIYNKVMNNLHHGQQTMLLRKFFYSLSLLVDQNNFDDVTDYLYKNDNLTLPGTDHVING